MRLRKLGFLAVASAAVGFFALSASAQQSAPCAAEDLPCRIAALEQRLAVLEGRSAPATTAPAAPRSTSLDVSRPCTGGCEDEAIAVCTRAGFVHGTAEEWRRDRSALVLTRAACSN